MSWDKVCIDLTTCRHDAPGRVITYREALREALHTALTEDPTVFIFGEGVDDPAGVFGTTTGLQKEFGKKRVFDTPICENTLTGVALGAALAGMRPVLVHMRTDFLLVSMDQLVNHVAKVRYMFGGSVTAPLVVRSIIGGGWGSAAQHSQALQALFAHVPGLKVVMPSSAYDAKGLLLASIADNAPVIFIEHRWLYDHKENVPAEAYLIPLGKALVRRAGSDITLV
ncbi:MAG: alpha-ketoacid dehydrogenase subunit beta, partial [Candidatus Omnitrophota bacterium]